MIEFLYVFSGLVLPAFYLPQILKLARDQTGLAGYSLGKATSQLLLRLPALVFVVTVVQNPLMNLVVSMDVLGRGVELVTAIASLRRQGVCVKGIARGWLASLRPSATGWPRFVGTVVGVAVLAAIVSNQTDHEAEAKPMVETPQPRPQSSELKPPVCKPVKGGACIECCAGVDFCPSHDESASVPSWQPSH